MRYGPRQPLNRGSNKLVPTSYDPVRSVVDVQMMLTSGTLAKFLETLQPQLPVGTERLGVPL
jgi:hypothetical protein